jgi:hypothetical protein
MSIEGLSGFPFGQKRTQWLLIATPLSLATHCPTEAKAARSPNSGPTQPLPAHLSNPMLAVMAGEVVERTSEGKD